MKKTALSGVLALLCFYLSNAQTGNIKPLTIGDKVPPLVISNVINYSSDKINLSALKGKLVILDFWSSWCGACISLFPHLQQLQERFGDSIAIILVNTRSHLSKDNAKKINTILSNVHKRTGTRISLPASFDNPLLDQYFPANMLPHEVWIAPDGRVQAITSYAELTEVNINAVLQGKSPEMAFKKDNTGYDPEKPLFVNGNGGTDTAMRFRSILTGYLPGLEGVCGMRMENNLIRGTYLINQPLQVLVRSAYPWLGDFTDNRTIARLKYTKYNTTGMEQENKRALYCYDLTIPPTTDSILHEYMQQDMQRYFNLRIYTEKKLTDCLLICTTGKTITYSTGEPSLDIEKGTLRKYMHNYKVADALKILNRFTSLPVILEGTESALLSIDLPFDICDSKALATAFEAAGFTAIFSKRVLNILVVTDYDEAIAF